MRNWIVVLKAYFEAETYAKALGIAETVRQNAGRELDPGDEVITAAVVPGGMEGSQHETVTLLRSARNALIKLGDQRAVDVAREMDMIADILDDPAATLDHHRPYDYGKFLQVVADVTKMKEPAV